MNDLSARWTTDADAWDAAVQANGGHLLQSWGWGALKAKFGWGVERIALPSAAGPALAQVLFREKAGVSVGYIPRGPVLPEGDLATALDLWRLIDRTARQRRALTMIVEPNQPFSDELRGRLALAPGPKPVQPARTVKVTLGSDEALLAQMHQKTRYNVRLAQRRGVVARIASPDDVSVGRLYALLQDTSARNEFAIHARDYYAEFLRLFGRRSVLLFAEIDGRLAAGLVAAAFGDEAIYMYGASSTKDRAHAAGFYLQYEAMRWARAQGCTRYDLWGIPSEDPDSTRVEDGAGIAATRGDDWRGLYEFKTRFGGTILRSPETLERRYHPLLASLAQRLYRWGGAL